MKYEELLKEMRPVPPPESLRVRVLAAARAAAFQPAELSTWVDRVWECRPLRLSWAWVLAGLVASHVALSWSRGKPAERPTVGDSATRSLDVSLETLGWIERATDRPRIIDEILRTQSPL